MNRRRKGEVLDILEKLDYSLLDTISNFKTRPYIQKLELEEKKDSIRILRRGYLDSINMKRRFEKKFSQYKRNLLRGPRSMSFNYRPYKEGYISILKKDYKTSRESRLILARIPDLDPNLIDSLLLFEEPYSIIRAKFGDALAIDSLIIE